MSTQAQPASSSRLLRAGTLLPIALLLLATCGLYTIPVGASYADSARGALYLAASLCLVQLVDAWLLSPLLMRFLVPGIVRTVIKGLLLFVVCFTFLRSWYGFDIMPLLTTSAVLSFVLGLALQDTLANFFSGLTINLEKPYKVGDWINIGEACGRVVEINWRTTKLLTKDNQLCIFPNNTMSKERIDNLSSPGPVSGYWIYIDIALEHPPNQVFGVIRDCLSRIPSLPTVKAPEVFLTAFPESGVTYGIRLWLDDWSRRNQLANEVRVQLWYTLQRNKINLPYPVRDVYLHQPKEQEPDMPQAKKLALLGRCPIFANQSPAVLEALASAMVLHHFGSGTLLYKQGEAGDSLHLLSSGKVLVTRDGVTLAELGPGSLFGEMSLLTGEPRSATVQAREDCFCLCLSRASFQSILALHPAMLEPIGEVIAQRQFENTKTIEEAKAQQAGAAKQKTRESIKTHLLQLMRNFLG